jgi:hypothetical protein
MEYYLATKNEALAPATSWMNFGNIILREGIQTQNQRTIDSTCRKYP